MTNKKIAQELLKIAQLIQGPLLLGPSVSTFVTVKAAPRGGWDTKMPDDLYDMLVKLGKKYGGELVNMFYGREKECTWEFKSKKVVGDEANQVKKFVRALEKNPVIREFKLPVDVL